MIQTLTVIATITGLISAYIAFISIPQSRWSEICVDNWLPVCELLKVKPSLEIQVLNAKRLGDSAIKKGKSSKTNDELKDVEKDLVDAITGLEQLPPNFSNNNEITSMLKDYKSSLLKVRTASKKVPCTTALFGDCVSLPLALP